MTRPAQNALQTCQDAQPALREPAAGRFTVPGTFTARQTRLQPQAPPLGRAQRHQITHLCAAPNHKRPHDRVAQSGGLARVLLNLLHHSA